MCCDILRLTTFLGIDRSQYYHRPIKKIRHNLKNRPDCTVVALNPLIVLFDPSSVLAHLPQLERLKSLLGRSER